MEKKASRILIVDDNEAIHYDFKEILGRMQNAKEREDQLLREELFGDELKHIEPRIETPKYIIDNAYQGMEAIKMVDQSYEDGLPYALIFMDVRMPPGINGVETIRKIWEKHPEIEIVLCTAFSDYTWEKILDEFGGTDHLLFMKKPFDGVSIKQTAFSLTTKWHLARANKNHLENLEFEVEKRTERLNELVGKLSEEVSIRRENEKLLSTLANFDALTGLANRFFFNKSLKEIIGDYQNKTNKFFALFFIDIDYFKQVNDLMGHDVGDLLLQEISKRLNSCLKNNSLELDYSLSSTEKNKTQGVFRLGGDEFTALVTADEIEQVLELAQTAILEVKKPYFISNNEIVISCSIGISLCPNDATDLGDLIKFADIAMYRAKEIKATAVLFDRIKDTAILDQRILEEELTKALSNKQIVLNYQALFNEDNSLIGAQALARWNHPRRGMLLPGEFIAIAEKSYYIIEIGKYILQMACRHLKKLHQLGHKNLFVFVNCTNKQFYDNGFLNMVKSTLKEVDLEPRCLQLGLEEKFSIKNPERSLAIIENLKNLGTRFGIEGVGKESSILSFLKKVPEDSYIRIDRTYIEKLEDDPSNVTFLYAMLDLIKSRRLNAIVSGIETEKQKEIVSKKKCIVQGFYYNKPKIFEEFIEDINQYIVPFDSIRNPSIG